MQLFLPHRRLRRHRRRRRRAAARRAQGAAAGRIRPADRLRADALRALPLDRRPTSAAELDRFVEAHRSAMAPRPRRRAGLHGAEPVPAAIREGALEGGPLLRREGLSAQGLGAGFASPRLRGEGCRRQQACAAGEGEGAAQKEARRFGPGAPSGTAPSPPLRFAPLVRPQAEPSPRKRGEANPRSSPRCHALTPSPRPAPSRARDRAPAPAAMSARDGRLCSLPRCWIAWAEAALARRKCSRQGRPGRAIAE